MGKFIQYRKYVYKKFKLSNISILQYYILCKFNDENIILTD